MTNDTTIAVDGATQQQLQSTSRIITALTLRIRELIDEHIADPEIVNEVSGLLQLISAAAYLLVLETNETERAKFAATRAVADGKELVYLFHHRYEAFFARLIADINQAAFERALHATKPGPKKGAYDEAARNAVRYYLENQHRFTIEAVANEFGMEARTLKLYLQAYREGRLTL